MEDINIDNYDTGIVIEKTKKESHLTWVRGLKQEYWFVSLFFKTNDKIKDKIMGHKFIIDSKKCINHNQPLKKLYSKLMEHFKIEEHSDGYITFVTLYDLYDLEKFREEIGYTLELNGTDGITDEMLEEYNCGHISGALTICDDE